MTNLHEEKEMTLEELEDTAKREEIEARREKAKADKKTAKMEPVEKVVSIGAIALGAAVTVGSFLIALLKGKYD